MYGDIPSGINNLVNLTLLSLFNTEISGPIPQEMGLLYNLRSLSLRDNRLSGEIPSSFGNLSSLLILRLGNNNLVGPIPSSLGKLKQLSQLDLYQNDLGGIIPERLFDITSLSIALNLSHNHFVGVIPHSVGNLKSLTTFDVSDNNLSGPIPSALGQCISLEYLSMQGNQFQGYIPEAFNTLKGIREIDLSSNKLSGQIPKFLESLLLEKLNLSFNHFKGEVPINGVFANSSAISIVGNSLCGGIVELQLPKCLIDNPQKHKISLVFKILISIAAVVLGAAILSLAIFCWVKRRRSEQISETMWRKTLPKVSYKTLLKATEGFSSSHLIGSGSFGCVYKGILNEDGNTVAIKVLNLQQVGASRSFMAECKAMRSIRHRNLVKVITACSTTDFQGRDFKAIVYEFMANGNLEKWLHPAGEDNHFGPQKLTFLQRLNIMIDVASALDYLHNHCKDPILHCDLKPSNVLLNGELTAQVGDFGLIRFLSEVSSSNPSSTMGVKGTVGYIAPGNCPVHLAISKLYVFIYFV